MFGVAQVVLASLVQLGRQYPDVGAQLQNLFEVCKL